MDDHQFTPEQRSRIRRIRAEIADGSYDTPERLEAAVEMLAGRLEKDVGGLRPTNEVQSARPREK